MTFHSVPQGLEDVSSYPTLFAELIGTGKWTVDELKKLAGLNFLRVLQEVERIRDEFKRAQVPPYEDVLLPRPKENNCSSQEFWSDSDRRDICWETILEKFRKLINEKFSVKVESIVYIKLYDEILDVRTKRCYKNLKIWISYNDVHTLKLRTVWFKTAIN